MPRGRFAQKTSCTPRASNATKRHWRNADFLKTRSLEATLENARWIDSSLARSRPLSTALEITLDSARKNPVSLSSDRPKGWKTTKTNVRDVPRTISIQKISCAPKAFEVAKRPMAKQTLGEHARSKSSREPTTHSFLSRSSRTFLDNARRHSRQKSHKQLPCPLPRGTRGAERRLGIPGMTAPPLLHIGR